MSFPFLTQLYKSEAPVVKFKRLHSGAIIPTRATEGAACFDLYSYEEAYLKHYKPVVTVGTGVAIELPPGHVGLVCSRSGLAARRRIFVLNAPGVIDEDYRGELKVILGMLPNDVAWPALTPEHLPAYSRIAQLMVLPLPQLNVEVVDELSTTTRGEGGLGSTGV